MTKPSVCWEQDNTEDGTAVAPWGRLPWPGTKQIIASDIRGKINTQVSKTWDASSLLVDVSSSHTARNLILCVALLFATARISDSLMRFEPANHSADTDDTESFAPRVQVQ